VEHFALSSLTYDILLLVDSCRLVAFKYHIGHTALVKDNPDLLEQTLGLWDPLGCLGFDFCGIGNEATIGYFLKWRLHGRVAMAVFIGYIAQSTDFVSGPHGQKMFFQVTV